ncbi:MAG: hypothetical protein ABI640_05460 [Gammaproteobacteria bacterium]
MKATTSLAIALVASAAARVDAQPQEPAPPPCNSADAHWVCGQQTPEDLVALGGAAWVISSAYQGAGGINLIKVGDRKSVVVFPSAATKQQLDRKTYPECPGPPDATKFTTHGVFVESGRGPVVRAMAVGHGARESIEVFQVDMRPATPSFTWVGCVIAPMPIGLNAVRGVADGGFLTTNWLPRGGGQDALQNMMAGEKNGELWEWHTKSGWQKVPGSEAAGANGIELSADGKTIYMAAWGSQSFIRLSRGAKQVKRDEIPLGFRVDNIHFARDGSLLAAGQITDPKNRSSRVVKVDPKTLVVKDILTRPDDVTFGGNTTAIEIGNSLWLGSYRGDRVAIVPAR